VVLDSDLRLPLDSRLVATARDVPVWVVTGERAPMDREYALKANGVEVLHVGGRTELSDVLTCLSDRGITRLMVETGPIVAAAFLKADLVDEAVLFRSPDAIGPDGIDALEGMSLDALTDRLMPSGREMAGTDTVEHFIRRTD
jgi:diaminohydroxyphosphoribosylaminopyrimidine deaminase/5-amino-6-(5-phosphoribosylamino)uracil reductase